jgi:tetratricopeptide (TPR) repeat protein
MEDTAPTSFPDLRRRYREIDEALSAPESRERAEVRESIVALFRDADRDLAELTEFRESIRGLIDRYKASFPAPVPPPAAPPARSGRVDHLGSSTYSERAWSAIAGCRYDVAVREAQRALELAPGEPRAATLLGWARAAEGEAEEAIGILEGVLAGDPARPLANAALGLALLRAGRPADAAALLERLVGGTSDRTALLYGHHFLGMALARSGRHPEAREAFGRALDFGPGLVEAYWHVGRTYYLDGDLQGAADAWRRGAEANRFDPWAERCEEAVACLNEGRPVVLD